MKDTKPVYSQQNITLYLYSTCGSVLLRVLLLILLVVPSQKGQQIWGSLMGFAQRTVGHLSWWHLTLPPFDTNTHILEYSCHFLAFRKTFFYHTVLPRLGDKTSLFCLLTDACSGPHCVGWQGGGESHNNHPERGKPAVTLGAPLSCQNEQWFWG